MGSIVKHLHLPLKDAWDFTLKEFYAVLGQDEQQDNGRPFDEEEEAELEHLRQLILAKNKQ